MFDIAFWLGFLLGVNTRFKDAYTTFEICDTLGIPLWPGNSDDARLKACALEGYMMGRYRDI